MSDLFEEQLKKLKGKLQAEARQKPVKAGTNPMFGELMAELGVKPKPRKAKPKKKPTPKRNGSGYEYVQDPETGRMRTRAQVEWEKYHVRKVRDHERVFFRNGDKTDFSKENLVLGFKSGVPLDMLTCKHCGARGQWAVEEKPID